MELGEYLKIVWRWLWLIVVGVGMAGTSTYLAVHDQPPSYQATATLVVGQILQDQEPTQSDVYLAQSLAQTYTQLAQRSVIREAARQALALDELPQYEVRPVSNTQLLEIEVTDIDPQRAAAVANEMANQLILHSPTNLSADEAQRRAFVAHQLDDLEVDIQATKDEIVRQREALGSMFSAREIADTQNQIAALQQKLNNLQGNYGQLLAVMGQGAVNTLSVIEPAAAPGSALPSGKLRTVLLAAAFGLILALGTVFLLEFLDDTIKTSEDVERATRLATLGGIGRIAGKEKGDKPNDSLITVKHPRSPISEAYRVLRTNLQFSSLDSPLQTLLVTSPSPVEGKSTMAANLAVVMAQAGRAVVLVDADLRRPVQHRIFGVPNIYGLSNVLLDPEPILDGNLQHTEVENLRVLTTGPLPPNPSELLGSQRMARLVKKLKKEADITVFDSPPSLAMADASVLAAQTDGVLLVVEAGRTRRKMAKEAVDRFQQVGANLLGVALNRLKMGRGAYSCYYHHCHSREAAKKRFRRSRRIGQERT
jgi:capsular exopolysaccharide synthesis family protein